MELLKNVKMIIRFLTFTNDTELIKYSDVGFKLNKGSFRIVFVQIERIPYLN
jgi:hypothetical protein